MNSIAGEPLNEYGPELAQLLTALGRQSGYVSRSSGQKSRSYSDDHGNLGQPSICNRSCSLVGMSVSCIVTQAADTTTVFV